MQNKFYALLLAFAFSSTAYAQTSSGTLSGKVVNKDTREALPFATVVVFDQGNVVNGTDTEMDGSYTIKPLDPGTYNVRVEFVNYQPVEIANVRVTSGKITELDFELSQSEDAITVEIIEYKVPLIDRDGGSSGGTITREEIRNMPSRSALGLATTVAGATDTGNGISIRGAREGSTWVYIDGIKVRGSTSLPKSAIEEVSVITGGVPANIGDVTGGVVNISLRNSSRFYTGGVEVITSGFAVGDKAVGLDHYGYNLVEGSLSGPLVFRKDTAGNNTVPLLGFFLSGNYTDIVDPGAAFGGVYRMKEDVRNDLLNNPLRSNVQEDGTVNGALYNADFLTSDSFEKIKTRLNVRDRSANLVAKIDVNTSSNSTLTLGGTGAFRRGHDFDYDNLIMNWDNNQQATDFDWRGYLKFSQRFKNAVDDEENGTASVLKNVFYSVMVDYSQTNRLRQDDTHKADLFKYGHVGYFDLYRGNTYDYNGSYFRQSGTQDMNINFTPSPYNPDLAAMTQQYFGLFQNDPFYTFAIDQLTDDQGNIITNPNDIYISGGNAFGINENPYASFTNIQSGNGLLNGQTPVQTYNLYNYLGTQNNNYQTSRTGQFRVSGMGSADIGDHAIQVGFEYEQRKDALYGVSPIGLWTLARLYTNSHTAELANTGIGYDSTVVNLGTEYYVYFNPLIGDGQYEFDYNLRNALGLNPNGSDFINTDNLEPEFLDIGMFGPDDLFNSGNSAVVYYGYDHAGNKLTGRKPTIEDFFSQTKQLGGNTYYTRPIGAFEPIYTSGYIMDKFAFDDLIFNVGVRVDRYDANQPVPKDPFVISEAFTVAETSRVGDNNVTHPSNIGDDFVVYVDDVDNPTAIKGYRDGNSWYNAQGQLVADPTSIFSNGKINPYLKVDPDAPLTSNAFKDFDPAVNIMPRIAFSFPISDEATFFAHYDVLTQRPTEFNRFNPIDYLYMTNRSVTITNPALKPERTTDYALGFQQVLSKSSSLKIEAFYRELRNQTQIRRFVGAYPSTYNAFDNIDFGTVKGLTSTYDLRRTGNIQLKTSYTLQFADGTGSSSQSQTALINAGLPNLRTVNPFNYDQRHRIVATVDYRYGDGKDYNGPVWFDKQVFANTGVNLIANLGSGTPYTPAVFAYPVTGEISPSTEGSINGARLPWAFTVDMNIDKNFSLKYGAEGDKQKTANLNVYLWVTNVFNTRNIYGVYRFTGTPDDDGYLASSQYQQVINNQVSPQGFINYYQMYVNNPYNLGTPRQIRLGIRFDF
ncbi:MAG: carboxypeptidase regulatory-like domain-containing protein [Flavobacteriales bacterium]